MRITAFAAGQLACVSRRAFAWSASASARLFEDSRSSEDFQLSTFDELSPIVDHKVSIMRGD